MSKNKIDNGFLGEVKNGQRKQGIMESNWFRGRHRVVMLDNKEQLVSFAAVSSIAYTNKSVRVKSDGVTPSSVPATAIAVILQIIIRDTASAATNCEIHARKNGSSDTIGQLVAGGGHINSVDRFASGLVGIDANYLIEYKVTATGANTLTGSINLIGYIERIK